MTGAQYETALKLACKQRNELREQRRVLQEACYQYQVERDEARVLANKYFVALKALDALPESECLPWEAGNGDD